MSSGETGETGEASKTGETPVTGEAVPGSTLAPPASGEVPPPPSGGAPAPESERPRPSRAPRVLLVVVIALVLAMLVLVAVVVVTRGGVGVGPPPEPARAEAEAFVGAWSKGDVATMQTLVDPPTASVDADLRAALAPIGATGVTATLAAASPGASPLTGEGDRRSAAVTVALALPGLAPVTWPSTVPLAKMPDGGWKVAWTVSVIHPGLANGGHFDQKATWAPRAALLGADGQPISSSAGSITINVRPSAVTDRPGLEKALADTLGIDKAAIDKAFTAAGPGSAAAIKTVPKADYTRVRDIIRPIPGLTFAESGVVRGIGGNIEAVVVGRTGPATAEQAAALGAPYQVGDEVGVSGLQASQQKALAGTPSVEVRVVNGAGAVVQSLAKIDGKAPAPIKTTIDPHIQGAAETALASVPGDKGAALVAVDRAGGVRALATWPGGGFNWATGQYPPGSTMKVVTAEALLASGLQANSPLTCPPQITAGGQPFHNFENEQAGSLTFAEAFAVSCNTAFIGAAQQLTGEQMHAAATKFGFDVDYDMGIPTVRGKFPDDGSAAARGAQAIGQGSVLVSPVHMASVAAAVMNGRWLAPSLLADRPPGTPAGEPFDPQVIQTLTGFMQGVVDHGTGTSAAVPGKVIVGKTGTAEFGSGSNLPTHAWFIGFSGDIAMAVVVNGGGVGGAVAAPLAAKFFSQI
jgi:cell division protein FtsI/penicillin-binding protein 2